MSEVKDKACQSSDVLNSETEYKDIQIQVSSSPLSHATSVSSEYESICRICLDKGTETLVAPCKCSGSAKFAHESCLLQWFFKTRRRKCELCLSEVNVKSVGFKPLQKWRLPTDSCDFVFYLFSLYCVIMFVFTGMIIWIATQGCLSPVCITLYVICSMSLVYFIYCCGCVEYSKTYWKACLTTNKNWRIYNREESARSKIKVSKVISIGSDCDIVKKAANCASLVSGPEISDSNAANSRISLSNTPSVSYSKDVCLNMTGSTTMIHTPLEIVTTQPNRTASSTGTISPVIVGSRLVHSGSISLLPGVKYSPHSSPGCPRKPLSRSQSAENQIKSTECNAQSNTGNYETPGQDCQEAEGGVANSGYHDTQL